MLLDKEKRDIFITENHYGGGGKSHIEKLLTETEMGKAARVYARATLQNKGDEIGYHIHKGESETYYILKGTALFNDNGTEYEIKAGEATFTPDGSGHSIKNNGDEPLEFMALVLYV